MLQNFINVFGQVIVFCLLGGIGLLLTDKGVIDKRVEKGLSDIVMYVASPCIILTSYMREFDSGMMKGFLINLVLAFSIHFIAFILCHILIKEPDRRYRNVLSCLSIFFNCGMISIILAQALYGDKGAFYCSVYMSVTNLLIWTYGYAKVGDEGGKIPIKKIFLNPGFLAVFAGLAIFLFSIKIYSPIASTIKHLGNMNAPLGLILIGSRLSGQKIKDVLLCKGSAIPALIRLILAPGILMGIMYAIGLRGDLPVIAVICSCPPAANLVGLFSIHFHNNENKAANMLLQQTILSMLTITLLVSFAQTIF